MTAPTHIAFALACGKLGDASSLALALLAFGSLLPDIDHPQSTLGRLFLFVSVPLNQHFGHRRTVHGFAVWGGVALLGMVWSPALWLGLGALSHITIDLLNIAGVQALMPFSEKVCVLFKKKWRFSVGSKEELVFLVIFGAFVWVGYYMGSVGGLRALIGIITGAPRIAQQQYIESGTQVGYFDGTLRFRDGRLEQGRWLVVGKEAGDGFAVWDERKKELIHVPAHAEFLRAYLLPTEQRWQTLSITGWARTKQEAFFYDGKLWRYAPPGAIIFGWVIGRELEVETIEIASDRR